MTTFRHSAREIARSAETVDHAVRHPNRSAAHADWAQGQTLHLACVYSNPLRWRSRERLFNDFRRHVAGLPNVVLHVGELAYGDRPFEVTSAGCGTDYQFRTRNMLWHKENLLNLVIWRFPKGWEYGGWVDVDVAFARPDVAVETIHQLQVFDWVQPFTQVTDLGPNHEVLNTRPGFAYAWENGLDVAGKPIGRYGWPGSPGFAWCFRRESYEACGGLLDTCILGSADHHMALGLVGWEKDHYDTLHCGQHYRASIRTWQRRAFRAVRGNVGSVPGLITHNWHGGRSSRGYETRWKVLRDNHFDPSADLFRDDEGVYQLTPTKPKLRDGIRRYFLSRNEDDLRVQ